jgi:hypothetical protein
MTVSVMNARLRTVNAKILVRRMEMQKRNLVEVVHPSGKLYTLKEASEIIGITQAALNSRMHRGITGEELWTKVIKRRAPATVNITTKVPPVRLKARTVAEQDANLRKLKSPTAYEATLYGDKA